jgi:hypothetical protein
MGRKSKRQPRARAVREHLALSHAAHLARTQLVRDRATQWDTDILDVIASALARVAPLYVSEPNGAKPRELLDGEIQGAAIQGGASTLLLKDGRALSGVEIKRADLRRAIALLKVAGIPELSSAHGQNGTTEQPSAPAKSGRMDHLRAQLAELEALMDFPVPQVPVDLANNLAISLARSAPLGRIANLAMRFIDALQEAHSGGDRQNVRVVLASLRAALYEAEQSLN